MCYRLCNLQFNAKKSKSKVRYPLLLEVRLKSSFQSLVPYRVTKQFGYCQMNHFLLNGSSKDTFLANDMTKDKDDVSEDLDGNYTYSESLIQDEKIKQSYLNAISDEYSRRLLDAIMDIPKSSLEISHEAQIPLRTVYRKIQTLHDSNLLKVSGAITDDGKKYLLYKSKIRSIITKYSKNTLLVKVTKNRM